jgi:hypothetical protein
MSLPYSEAVTFWVVCQIPSKLSILETGSECKNCSHRRHSSQCCFRMVLFLIILPHKCTQKYLAEMTFGDVCNYLCSSLLSGTLPYIILAALVFLELSCCLLISGDHWSLSGPLSLYCRLGGNHRSHPIHFFSLSSHCVCYLYLLYEDWCFMYCVQLYSCLKWENKKFYQYYFVLARSRSTVHLFCGAGDGTQGHVHARWALYHWPYSHPTVPLFFFYNSFCWVVFVCKQKYPKWYKYLPYIAGTKLVSLSKHLAINLVTLYNLRSLIKSLNTLESLSLHL